MVPRHLLIHFQQFDGMPSGIAYIGIFFCKKTDYDINLVFYIIFINHGVLIMMVVHVRGGFARVVMDERTLTGILTVVSNGMHQNRQTRFPACGYRNGRNAKHFRKAVKVDFHAPLLHDIHHVQSQHHGLTKFDELKRQIKVAFQAGGVNDIHNDVYFITHDTFPGDSFFHCIGSQAVDTGKVDQFKFLSFIDSLSFFLFHRYAGPVGHL